MTDTTVQSNIEINPSNITKSANAPRAERKDSPARTAEYKKPRNTEGSSNNGMATFAIKPGTPEFRRYLTAGGGNTIRDFIDVSIAITTLFRTVNALKHKELVNQIQDWFDTLHSENEAMRLKLEEYISSITLDENDDFISQLKYTPYQFPAIEIHFNNPNTMRFYRYIHNMNNHIAQMAKFNALGMLPPGDYYFMTANIIRNIKMYVTRVKKTLNVSRRDDGPYSPDEFIKKALQYKSVQAYIDNEITPTLKK